MLYLVEFMIGEEVSSSKSVEASTPLVAASKVARGSIVHFSVDRRDWIRVTPPGKAPFEYGYTNIGGDVADRKPVRKLGTPKA